MHGDGQGRTAPVSFDAVGLTYPSRGSRPPTPALDDLSFTVAEHEVVAVVGPSGSGKTTLLELICGLRRADSGAVDCAPAALMPQRDLLLPWLSAIDNAGVPRRIAGDSRTQARAAAAPWLQRLGLDGFEHAHPPELSGGMRQRVSIARTLLAGKPVLALDEPFAALDALTRADAQRWLARALTLEPRTVVLVTHDVEEAVLIADRVLVLSPRPGRIVATLPVPLPRPRDRTDPAVVALRGDVMDALGVAR